MAFAAAFQRNAFQNNAFQTKGLQVTDTHMIQLPVNCVLLDQQDMVMADTVIERRDPNIRTRTIISAGAGGRLSDNAPSFKSTTGSL